MPREWTFRSEAARSTAIGVVMAILLSGSVALAYVFTTTQQTPWTIDRDDTVATRPVNVGPLVLPIPQRFQRIADPPQKVGFDVLIEFEDQLDPQRKLQVAALAPPYPDHPIAALYRALDIMLSQEQQQRLQQWNQVDRFRTDQTTITWFTGVGRARGATQLHLLGVLTGQGQRYWVVYLSHQIDHPELLTQAMRSARRLFGVVISGVTWRNQIGDDGPTPL